MAEKSKTPAAPALTFEAAMDRLEDIVGKMESAQMPLDELLSSYEEGTGLIGLCQNKLTAAEQRIEIVARKTSESPISPSISPLPPLTTDPDVSLF